VWGHNHIRDERYLVGTTLDDHPRHREETRAPLGAERAEKSPTAALAAEQQQEEEAPPTQSAVLQQAGRITTI